MAMSSRKTRMSSMDDDIDAITPCPPETTTEDAVVSQPASVASIDDLRSRRSMSPSSFCSSVSDQESIERKRESVRALEEGTNGDPEKLWKRMLALQRIYGCYNSARMSAALSSGNTSLLRPSKACLDLMNDNMHLSADEAESVHSL
ncbi:hypothetical protein F4780DRAFT_169427 [Xylariomycetidae sp. FL0641]|nr:hypothetical protein F4780DRAFT_169427 [Xylariomycetidae sp. FL0641]